MKKITFILICLLAVNLTGCHFFWKRYHDRSHGFAVTLPVFWQTDTQNPQAVLIALAPLQGNKDKFRENLTVTAADLPDEESKEMFWEVNKKIIITSFPGYKSQLKEGELYAGVDRGQWISFALDSDQIPVKIKVKTVVWMRGLRVFTATCTAEETQYHNYEKTFEKIFSSFSFDALPPVKKTKPAEG